MEIPVSTERQVREGLTQRAILDSEIDRLVAFDDWAYFEANPETPTDHMPPHFNHDEIKEALENGDSVEAVFNQVQDIIAYRWFSVIEEGHALHIDSITIHPDYRDQGLGGHFLDEAEEIAAKLGLDSCTLEVDPLNGRGIYLYLKRGYRGTSYVRLDNNPYGLDKWVHMELALGPKQDLVPSSTEEKCEVQVDDEVQLEKLLGDGFVISDFIAATDLNNRHNQLVLTRTVQPEQL